MRFVQALLAGDAPWARPLRNAGKLGAGRGLRAVLVFASTAIAARALGLEDFGRLVLLHGLTLAVGDIVKCQSWEALLRYGAPALAAHDLPLLHRVLRFSCVLDIASTLIAVGVVVLAAEPLLLLFGIAELSADVARWYGTSIAFAMLTATPLGILRLLDEFGRIAWQLVLAPALRLLGGLVLLTSEAGLGAFLALWYASIAASYVLLVALAWHALRVRGLAPGRAALANGRLVVAPGAVRFAVTTNALSTLRLAPTHIALIAVGWYLNPAAAALYHVARQAADVLIKPQEKLLLPALYPEFARLHPAQGRAQRQRLVRGILWFSVGLAATLIVLLAVLGKPLLVLLYGADFAAAHTAMLILALAGLASVPAVPLEPYFLTAGVTRPLLWLRLVAGVILLAAITTLTPAHGLPGLALAILLHALLLSAGLAVLWQRRARCG